ncbi:MAG: IS1182 family transposase [archaeon]|nr:IS1182 family transposase [archaeon]
MNVSNGDYVKGQDRDQLILFPGRIEEYIDQDNAVRVIDEFVDSLDLEELGFIHFEPKDLGGRPAYDPYDLLKLYLYGYLNGIRTSRKLERECNRNIELIWLLKKLTPDFRTISDFRKDNIDCIKKVFRKFVELCKNLDLIGGELVGVDGTKLKGVNSKSRNFNKEKLEYRIKRLELHISEYLIQLEQTDKKSDDQTVPPSTADEEEDERPSDTASQQHAKEEIEKMKSKKIVYTNLLARLKETGRREISLTDPECRSMKNNEKIEPCYNAQISVDSKFHLIPEYYLTTEAVDHGELLKIATSTKEALAVENLIITADTGYSNYKGIKDCLDYGITPYVPDYITSRRYGAGFPAREFQKDRFVYNLDTDSYTCPAGKQLLFRSWNARNGKRTKLYWTMNNACSACPFNAMCTRNKTRGRTIHRYEFEEVIEEMSQRTKTKEGLELIQKRKELCEHVFGSIKRAFNQGYLLLKGLRKVNGEVGFTMIAYNMRRAINILGTRALVTAIKA